MLARSLLALALVAAALVTGGAVGAPPAIVSSVADGDTLRVAGGLRVRLVQIDAPEIGECYFREARGELLRLAPIGSSVALEADARLDQVDRHGRLLRYVRRGSLNVNVELVRRGAAVPYFFDGVRGRYAGRLEAAARSAKSAKRGLWAGCPTPGPLPLVPPRGSCDPNYSGCVPPYPPDLDCADLRALGLAPVRVLDSDPHRLDGDGDGIGCEPTG